MTKKEIASNNAKQFEITQLLALEAVQLVFDGLVCHPSLTAVVLVNLLTQ